jgi:tetratricopeptide (TPR) repeat protein
MKTVAFLIGSLLLTQMAIQPVSALTTTNSAITIAQSTETAADYIAQGDAKYNSGDKQGAIEDYDRAIELDPQNAEAYTYRGTAKYDLGDKQAAIEDYDKAIELQPDLALAYVSRSNVKVDLGDKESAIQDLSTAAELFKQQGQMGLYEKAMEILKAYRAT